ncbi:MAG: hypothetical protein WCA35_22465 [Kovacikia sp.]
MNLSRCFLATTAATAFVGLISLPSQAATLSFGTNGIEFSQPTRVQFTFNSSTHFYKSILSVFVTNPTSGYVDRTSQSNLFSQLSGSITSGTTAIFNFLPGFTYTLGLSNFTPGFTPPLPPTKPIPDALSPYVFSTTLSNNLNNFRVAGNPSFNQTESPNAGQPRAIFSAADPSAGSVTIFFEDGGFDGSLNGSGKWSFTQPNDADFNDFIVSAQVVPVPIPPPLAGLLVFGTLSFLRRRQATQS